MTTDWKDALASLSGLPDPAPEAQQPTTDNRQPTTDNRQPTTDNRQLTALHITVEKKGRGGKTATIVEGFECPDGEVDEIARFLRKRLGTGGSARCGEILIQGDRRNDVATLLREKGFKVK